MPKYDVTYACGHTGEVELFGKADYREWKLGQIELDICPKCRQKERDEQNRINAEANKVNGFAELKGSPRQIAGNPVPACGHVACKGQVQGTMRTDSLKKTQKKYAQKTILQKKVDFNRNTDTDILEYLDESNEPFATMVKRLIREDMKKQILQQRRHL